jgi:hypothetical protein
MEAAPLPIASEQPAPLVVAAPDQQPEVVPLEQVEVSPSLEAEQPREEVTPMLPARARTRTTAKVKRVRRRVIRKPKIEAAPIPVASEQPAPLVVAAPEPESQAVPLEAAEVSPSLDAELLREEAAQAEAGFNVPQILLEGDELTALSATGPGQKYALGPSAPPGQPERHEAALPDAYGTGRLLLAASDPHWLYAHWDLTHEQQRHYNALSADHHLAVRVYPGAIGARPVTEVHVHPESRHWFIHVDRADTRYAAELGYYRRRHEWVAVAVSPPAVTPADSASTDQTVRFATIPAHTRQTQLAALAKQRVPAHLPPADEARERALAELVAQQLARQDEASSAEIPELIRGLGEKGISPTPLAQPAPLGGEVENVSSPMAPAEQCPGGFWFSINAELVIYGATEPGASLTIGGWPIASRPDGTFSCRCSLPDGDHAVTVSAMSAEGELRQAKLTFSRRTDYQGAAAAAPQDLSLQPPGAENPTL